MSPKKMLSFQSPTILYVLVCAPMLFLIGECVRSAYRDLDLVRMSALQKEIGNLRSQATRHAAQLEVAIDLHGVGGGDWNKLVGEPWLKTFWGSLAMGPHDLYAAVVDASGKIVLDTDYDVVGRQLEPVWYEQTVPEAGLDVVRLQDGPLAAHTFAYDVRLPILLGQRRIGEYHQGLNGPWFDREVAAQQWDVLKWWSGVLFITFAFDAAAAIALVRLALRDEELGERARRIPDEWARRLRQVATGLAHEIRNPLHALRINVHALRRSYSGRATLEPDDLMAALAQSDRAIDTLEGLMRDLVCFTMSETGECADVNLVSEVQATLNLMNDEMRRKQVVVRTHFAQNDLHVSIDPGRMRQVLLNMLTFAQSKAGTGGHIDVEVSRTGTMAHVAVSDSGPPLTTTQILHLFEPFQAPRETGSGLGLALVKYFTEQVGGAAECVAAPAGSRFCLRLPLVDPHRKHEIHEYETQDSNRRR
jgi:signal transduction histidine kinase